MFRHSFRLASWTLYMAIGLSLSISAWSQTATGSILGTVTDSSGAAVPNVAITIKSLATGTLRSMTSSETGTYSAVALVPGDYLLTYTASGFVNGQKTITVTVGGTANGNFTLTVGSTSTRVEVTGESLATVNTVQAVVEDVQTTKEIEAIPLNGRNFLDLAQLNAGVQIQDGGNLDPTKQGFAGISIQGRSGRSTRIQIDGIDITDDTVGTTTINLSEESIQEFQVAQSTLDPANSLSSSGAVNVITRAGSNNVHGSAFYQYRNNSMSAPINGISPPFDRSQVGFRVGGPFKKDRLFWFANYEHTLQHGTIFAAAAPPFTSFTGAFAAPYHETQATGRLDFNVSPSWRAFYSIHFNQMNLITGFGGILFSPFANRNYNSTNSFGLDGVSGRFTHSFRVGLLNYRNYIVDARSQVAGIPNPFPNGEDAGIAIGSGTDPYCAFGINLLCTGPNWLAPQTTLQHTQEVRYDGSTPIRSHTIRYGFEFEHIPQAGFSSFSGYGPILSGLAGDTVSNMFPGGDSNPLNYPLRAIELGNGLGYSSEKSGLAFPHGGFPGKRFGLYIADFWKAKPNLTITAALRYNRITGRTDSDARALPVLEPLIPGSSHAPHQPNLDFSPQLGIAWDPFKNGKTSIRAGAGLFYDNFLVENLIFDRPLRIPGGLANATPVFTSGTVPGSSIDVGSLIGQPIGAVVDSVVQLQADYQAFNAQQAANFDPNGAPGFQDPNVYNFNTLYGVLTPNLKLPRSVSFNIGVQRQLTNSLFLSVDYIRNVNTHSLLNRDVNQVGAASTLDKVAAQSAIDATLQACGAANIDAAIADCSALHPGGATIEDFGANGLGSPASGLYVQFVNPNNGYAFPGINKNFGQIMLSDTAGRSVYNAVQFRLKQTVARPFAGVTSLSWQATYNLSRNNSTAPDQDVVYGQNAHDNINPLHYFGPNSLDRTNMLSFAATFNIVGGLQLTAVARINSALANTLTVPYGCSCGAEVFLSDVTGDGTGGDVLPGTSVGAFGRSVKVGSLNGKINNFNSNYAGQLTPAGQALVGAGLMTAAQMQQLGATIASIPQAPAHQVGIDNFVANDIRLSYLFRLSHLWHGFGESATLQPTLDLYNVVNKANFDPPGGFVTAPLRGVLDGSVGSANGTLPSQRINRYGLGSGVFSQGVPRALEVGMRLTF
ncbi:MAG TPA: TonB-dependent receptor [Terriglobales bacterium]|nr:TonB-dependent receptor [Terriglobales bacterium]